MGYPPAPNEILLDEYQHHELYCGNDNETSLISMSSIEEYIKFGIGYEDSIRIRQLHGKLFCNPDLLYFPNIKVYLHRLLKGEYKNSFNT